VSGPENTIYRFAVLAQAGHEWTEAADVPPGSHSVKLSQLQAHEAATAFCVEAVGKASILNHFSQPIRNPRAWNFQR
jgi:hypothetical protein